MKYLTLYKSFLVHWVKKNVKLNVCILLISVLSVFAFVSSFCCFFSTYIYVENNYNNYKYAISYDGQNPDEFLSFMTENFPKVNYILDNYCSLCYKYNTDKYIRNDSGLVRYSEKWNAMYDKINKSYNIIEGRDFTEDELLNNKNVIIVSENSKIPVGDVIEIAHDEYEENSDTTKNYKLNVIGIADNFVVPVAFFEENPYVECNIEYGKHDFENYTSCMYLSTFGFVDELSEEQLNTAKEFMCYDAENYEDQSQDYFVEKPTLQIMRESQINYIIVAIVGAIVAVFTALQLYTLFLHLANKSKYHIAVIKVTGCHDKPVFLIMLGVSFTYVLTAFLLSLPLFPLFMKLCKFCRLDYIPQFSDFLISFVILSAAVCLAVIPGFKKILNEPLSKGGI